VYLQEVMVPKWVRGEKKLVFTSGKKMTFRFVRLRFSSNPKTGIKATVIEVKSLEESALGEAKVKGKIVFF
jgi:hypothetical protein